MNVFTKTLRTIGRPQVLRSFATPRRAKSTIIPVFSDKAVHPIGSYYSQAIIAKGFVFLSAQLPASSDGKLIAGTVAEQAHKMCQNAGHVLEEAGSDLDSVVKVDLYMRDMTKLGEVNEVYQQYFKQRPARTTSEVSKMPAGADMMLDLVAVV